MNAYKQKLGFIKDQLKEIYQDKARALNIHITEKSTYDIVTTLDLEIEREVIRRIKAYDPDASFLSEEFNKENPITENLWIIDPIDGTCNYGHGIEMFGIQIALYDQKETQLSVIYFPFRDELFTALKNEGVWLNGVRVERHSRPMNHSLISFGDFNHDDEKLFEMEHRIMRHVSFYVERIRMYGAASVDFAYCACGRLDGNFTFVKNQWDIAPGLLMCRETGMVITDAMGKPYDMNSETVAVFSTEDLMHSLTAW